MRHIYGFGETVFDIIFRNDQPLRAVPGGSTFNTMVSLGRCGLHPTMLTEVGDDHVGTIVTRFLHANGVDTCRVTIQDGRHTPVSLAFLDAAGDAHYQFYRDTSSSPAAAQTVSRGMPDFQPDDVVVFGSFYAVNPSLRPYTRDLVQRAHDAQSILYYDVNFRPAHRHDLPSVLPSIEANMRQATIVRVSHEDLVCVYGSLEAGLSRVRDLCPRLLVTYGSDGVDFISPTLAIHRPALPVAPVSTIGAGDSFNAGIVHSIATEGWMLTDLKQPSAAMVTTMVDRAQRFAADVCASFENYVTLNFAQNIL